GPPHPLAYRHRPASDLAAGGGPGGDRHRRRDLAAVGRGREVDRPRHRARRDRAHHGGSRSPATGRLEPALERHQVHAPKGPRRPRRDGLRILVVEDDADARLLLKDSLEALGAVVQIAASVQDAIETFEREPPHVLVSDIRLPDDDGYTLLARVRAAEAASGRRTPAIALTAYPRVEDRARALEAGFAMHVPKPVAPDALAAVIAAVAGPGDALP